MKIGKGFFQSHVGAGLNGLDVPTEANLLRGQLDHGATAQGCTVEVIFKDLKARFVEFIRGFCSEHGDGNLAIVGCVAWLDDHTVLQALLDNDVVTSLIVNKERRYLRADTFSRLKPFWVEERAMTRPQFWSSVFETQPHDPAERWEAVRCCGDGTAKALMHNKFLAFLRRSEEREADPGGGINEYDDWTPFAAWTGSSNFTHAADRHLENAVLIHDARIADAFVREWGTIACLSEPLASRSWRASPSRFLPWNRTA